jgi:hypothetical protein
MPVDTKIAPQKSSTNNHAQRQRTKPQRAAPVIRLPKLVADDGYASRHLDVGGLSPEQAQGFRVLLVALKRDHVQLGDKRERHVETAADTIRWIGEQLWAACQDTAE